MKATVKKKKKLFVLTFFLRNDVRSQNIEQNRVHSGSIPLLLLLSDLSPLHQLVYDTFAGIPFILSNPPPLFLFLVTVISVTR